MTCSLGRLLLSGVLWLLVGAVPVLAADTDSSLSADTAVHSLTVTLHVGAAGSALREPVALDLGLGFPLWLDPAGGSSTGAVSRDTAASASTAPAADTASAADDASAADNGRSKADDSTSQNLDATPASVPAVYGAVANTTTARGEVPAGGSARFTFSTQAAAGQDALGYTRHLLSGVRVADIVRIGFASARASDWILAGYELDINGQRFAGIQQPAANVEDQQPTLAARLAELNKQGAALQDQYEKLQVAVQDNTASVEQVSQFRALEAKLRKLSQEIGQLQDRTIVDPASAAATRAADLARWHQLQQHLSRGVDQLTQQQPASAAAATPDATSLPLAGALPPQPASGSRDAPGAAAAAADSAQPAASQPGTTVPADPPGQFDGHSRQALVSELRQIEGRLRGDYPWFVDRQFQPRGAAQGRVQHVRVWIETCPHAGADTQNLVFFSTGGHKYLLNASGQRLTAAGGPQAFDLDLLAGPLRAADLRAWELIMLASPGPQGAAPDRWHPQRVLVEMDKRIVYDSDQSVLDRQSLAAIRLVPPVQLDQTGQPVTAKPGPREVTVWRAGQGQGLDLVHGGALPLTDTADAPDPLPEDELAPFADEDADSADAAGSDSADASGSEFPSGFDPFPGETGPAPDTAGGSSGDPWPDTGWDSGSTANGSGGTGGWPGGAAGGGAGGGWPGGGGGSTGGGGSGGSGKGSSPPATGKPFQLDKVWLASGWKVNEPFTIQWQVTGDAAELNKIDHFFVALKVMRPDQSATPFKNLFQQASVDNSKRTYTATIDATVAGAIKQPFYFVAPYVAAVPTAQAKQAGMTTHDQLGPARAVFPGNVVPQIQPVAKTCSFVTAGNLSGNFPLSSSPPPSGSNQRAVWFFQDTTTPGALDFSQAAPGAHLAVRPSSNDSITVDCETTSFTGKQQLVAHLGFVGKAIGNDSVHVRVDCVLQGGGKTYKYPTLKRTVTTMSAMRLIEQVVDEADLGVPVNKLRVSFTFQGGGWNNSQCVPGILGLRLLPVAPGTTSTAKTVHADLEIDRIASRLVPDDVRFQGNSPAPKLVIKNNGPQDIPADTLNKMRVKVIYYLGQYGDKWGDIHTAKYRKELHCGPNPIRHLAPGKTWTGPLKVGQSLSIVPLDSNKSLPKNEAWLAADGKLHGKLQSKKAWKLMMTWANIQLPGATLINDPNTANNSWQHELTQPVIVGRGPLDFEAVAFQQQNFQGTRARYEMNPDFQRQRLIWDLANEPNQPDMNHKVHSIMVGAQINVWPAWEHHFYSPFNSWHMPVLYGKAGGNLIASGVVQCGSFILCPRAVRAIGVEVNCDKETFFNVKLKSYRSMFFPLPEDKNVNKSEVTGLPGVINDDIDDVWLWAHPPGSSGQPTVGWLKATLYEDANLGGRTCTLNSQGKTRYYLDKRIWDGWIGGINVQDEISSLKIEAQGKSTFAP